MKLRLVAANVVTVLVSVLVGVLLTEGCLRLVLNPSDYLTVKTVSDKILGIRVASHSAGFDEWGFRNPRVPPQADVVAIGDSHTYGNTAAMEDAWPSVVARATGLSVYNLALGGYGPNQYYYLLTTRGLTLHPKWVVCGLYMGDDFENAFSITYGLDYWSSRRNGRWPGVNADIWEPSATPGSTAAIRNWLSQNSITYRLVAHGPVLGSLVATARFRELSRNTDPLTTSLTVPEKNIREAFRPLGLANRLDQTRGPVREGMRITFELLKEMDDACRREGCKFVVVVIPTKETVFSRYLEGSPHVHLHEAIDRLIRNERIATTALLDFLDLHGVAYVDTLPALQDSTGEELYTRTSRDMHPNKNGYKVIGDMVARYLGR
jgi:hypothetical protein